MSKKKSMASAQGYGDLVEGIAQILEAGRNQVAWTLNSIMSAVYWQIGRRIVEFEQAGRERAEYGERIIEQLSNDLSQRIGRGFGKRNLFQMRAFYLAFKKKVQTLSAQSAMNVSFAKVQTPSAFLANNSPLLPATTDELNIQTLSGQSSISYLGELTKVFRLSWSQYVRLLSIKNEAAREFYEAETLRSGWSVRQLDRQIAARL